MVFTFMFDVSRVNRNNDCNYIFSIATIFHHVFEIILRLRLNSVGEALL